MDLAVRSDLSEHPCLQCGACCAYFRVSFYWREAETEHNPDAVPLELTEDYSELRRIMRGTNQKHHVRCVALEGKVGHDAKCSIYSLRPSPCREFAASFEDGVHRERCDEARARYSLPALKLSDWIELRARLSACESTCYTAGHEKTPDPPGAP